MNAGEQCENEELLPYEDTEFRAILQAIPDGGDDYAFAAVKFDSREEGVSVEYCLF